MSVNEWKKITVTTGYNLLSLNAPYVSLSVSVSVSLSLSLSCCLPLSLSDQFLFVSIFLSVLLMSLSLSVVNRPSLCIDRLTCPVFLLQLMKDFMMKLHRARAG